MTIAVYIPVHNSLDWCRTLEPVPGLRYIASDNASSDGSAEALRERGVEVIVQPRDLGRIGNWAFCVAHFLESGADWMKWLFAGDVLAPDFAHVAARATEAHPEAGIVIGDNIHVDGEHRAHYKVLPEKRLLSPAESLELLAAEGNWFYSPINQMFHRRALGRGADFGPFEWAADVYFCMSAAAREPVLYWPESFGEFHAQKRAHFRAQRESLRALLETALVREMAAARLAAMTRDPERHAALSAKIEADVLRRLASRRLGSTDAGALLRAGLRKLRR